MINLEKKEVNKERRNRIIFYSGGKSSFTVAHLVKEQYPNDNIVLYFTDTLWEDPDLYRFIHEGADKLGLPMLVHSKRQTPIELMYESKIVFSSRLGLCSNILKMKVSSDFIRKGIKPEYEQWYNKELLKNEDFTKEPVLYFGISWDEAHREKDIRKNWSPYEVEMPLMEQMIDNNEILLLYGIEQPKLYEHGFAHNNCFSGEEKFITNKGLKTFKETAGSKVKVLGEQGNWQDAEIKSFGEQELVELVVQKSGKKKTILTTKNHRWFIRENHKERKEVTTSELVQGNLLWSMYGHIQANIEVSPTGIARGIVYGDNTYPRNSWSSSASVALHREKEELSKFFPLSDKKIVNNAGVTITDLPQYWKLSRPDLSESKSYLLGWLSGYIATSGTVEKNSSSIVLSSSKEEDLLYVADLCAIVGISVNMISTTLRKGSNQEETPIYSISLVDNEFNHKLLLRKKHIENYKPSKNEAQEWKVVSVKETNKKEEVYCAVVPQGNAFTLEGNIYTGNCMARCVKAGQGHYLNLLEQMPDVFYSIMMEELQISTYVSSYHYLRKPKLHDRNAWLSEEEITQKLTELDEAYRDWALGKEDKPKPWAHPAVLAPEKIENKEGLVIDYCFEYFTDKRSGKSRWRRVEHKITLVDSKGKKRKRKPAKAWRMKSSKYKTVETRHKTPIKYSFMKKTINGMTKPYMIYDLFNDHTKNPESIDKFDIGGCACFIDYGLEGKSNEEIQESIELGDV